MANRTNPAMRGMDPRLAAALAGRRNTTMDNAMWKGYVTPGQVQRRPVGPMLDRPIIQTPTAQREPESAPPNTPVWGNFNYPPWTQPPVWSVPFSKDLSACVPQYEISVLLGCFTVPADRCMVIKEIGYEALNAAQDDVFELQVLVDQSVRAQWEDINIDDAQANPALKYGLYGHFRPMPTHILVDRNATVCVRGTLRGPINLAGVSPYFPGQPITTGNCEMKAVLYGWLAPLREDIDGGPRPTDLGDMDFTTLESDQSRGAFP